MKPKTFKVVASVDKPCPLMGVRSHKVDKQRSKAAGRVIFRTMIYDEPVEVENNLYYRRRIAAGDLQVVRPSAAKSQKRKAD